MNERDTSYIADDVARMRSEGDASEPSDDMRGKASQYAQQTKERAREAGEKVQRRADEGLDKAASGMDRAATQLREKAMQQGGKTGELGTKAADTLAEASDYLEQHDTGEILDDIEKYVREHPMQAVGAAVVGGFVLARILR